MDQPVAGQIRVLHVEDDPEFADLTAERLEAESDSIAIETVTDAAAGLDRLAEGDVDCVVSDYDVPGTDGIEFLEAVRERHPDLPFVLFTGEGSEAVASEAIGAGVTDYIQKGPDRSRFALLANRIVDAVEAAQIERANRRHLQAIDTAQEGIAIIAESGEFAYVNEAYADLYGYEPEEMVGEQFTITYPEGELDVLQGDVMPKMEQDGHWHGETVGLRADGSTFVEDHRLAETADGSLVCSVTDVTERRAHEQAVVGLHGTVNALMRADAFGEAADVTVTAVEAVVEHAATVVYYVDEDGDRLEPAAWNERATSLYGEPAPIDRDGGSRWRVFESGDRELYDPGSEIPDRLDEGTIHDELPGVLDPTGDVSGAMVLPLGEHGVLLAAATDPAGFREIDVGLVQAVAAHVTTTLDGIRSERALREEREFVDQAIETLNDVFYVLGPDRTLRRWNDRLVEVTGHPDDALSGMAIEDLSPPEEADRLVEMCREALSTGEATAESTLVDDDGNRVPYEFASARLTDPGGDVTGVVGIGRDVSRRKERERRLRAQNDRLENFSSIISHDLRNPLNVAEGRLQLAMRDCDSEHLEDVQRAHGRMASLIEDLLAVAREGETALEREEVQLAETVDSCWSNVATDEATLRSEASLTFEADRGQLQQLLENLFRNAVEHAGPDVTVTVGALPDGFYVEDDGPGIPPEERDRVVDPGYSAEGGGTGLGLNIVANVVEVHGWELSIESGEDGGARIEVTGVDRTA